MKEILNLMLFLFICFILFLLFRGLTYREGMTNSDKDVATGSNEIASNGIAGNASSYAASLKAAVIKSQDEFLISKYRSDYESAILNMDDLLSNLMLRTVLTANMDSPTEVVDKLAKMQQAKLALNSVMKFVDSQ